MAEIHAPILIDNNSSLLLRDRRKIPSGQWHGKSVSQHMGIVKSVQQGRNHQNAQWTSKATKMIKMETNSANVTLIAPEAAELTAMNAPQFRRSVLDLIEDGNSRIVIDLRHVSEVDSCGIGALVGLLKRIGLRGEMILCGMSDQVARIFRLTRMDMVFLIQPDSGSALRLLNS